jgi:hypothetical protein
MRVRIFSSPLPSSTHPSQQWCRLLQELRLCRFHLHCLIQRSLIGDSFHEILFKKKRIIIVSENWIYFLKWSAENYEKHTRSKLQREKKDADVNRRKHPVDEDIRKNFKILRSVINFSFRRRENTHHAEVSNIMSKIFQNKSGIY